MVALAGDVDGHRTVLVGALGGWALAYVLLGGPALGGRESWRAPYFLVVHVAVFGVLAWKQPSLLFLMFLGYPLVRFLVESVRDGVLWTLALALAAPLGPSIAWTRGTSPSGGRGRRWSAWWCASPWGCGCTGCWRRRRRPRCRARGRSPRSGWR